MAGGEIFGLKVGQLDFLDEDEKGSIRLYKTKGKKGAQGMQGRLVYMTKKVRELLLMCIRGKNNDDFVLTRDGCRGKIIDFRDAWERAYRAAGIVLSTTYGEVGPLLHDLRRSGAKGMVDRGVDRNVAMKIGGWQTEAMLRRYHILTRLNYWTRRRSSTPSSVKMQSLHPRKHSSAYCNRSLTTV